MRIYPVPPEGRYCIPYIAFIVLAVIVTLPSSARAVDLAVDCSCTNPSGTLFASIQDAVDSLPEPPPGQWNYIVLLSDCTENVSISGEHRLWLGRWLWVDPADPAPAPARITGVGGADAPVLSISGSQDIALENLVLTGGRLGLSVGGGSAVSGNIIQAEGNYQGGIIVSGNSSLSLCDGRVVDNGSSGQWSGIAVESNSSLSLIGSSPWFPHPQPLVISGNRGGGIRLDRSYLAIGGGVIIENSWGTWGGTPTAGILSFGGTLNIGCWTGTENVIRNNPIGVALHQGSEMSMYGLFTVQNNASLGVQVTEGSRAIFDEPVTIEGNPMGGVEVTSHSQAGFHGHNKIRNNGSATEPVHAGIWVDGTSQVSLEGGNEVTGNIGPGIFADINSSLDVSDATISGNTEEGVRVRHMSVVELQTGTDARNNAGGPLTCDGTSLVITNLFAKGPKCANIEGTSGGSKPRAVPSAPAVPNVEEMAREARRMAERLKKPE